ncbi:MOB kinase activator-like 2 isoform X2 [Calliphora vicina]|uniref:MOB kinase activator-like 2 isoform X2 n=1 Tax=Calliphora vicina TaxID=7373 RepID=UPI00325B8D28
MCFCCCPGIIFNLSTSSSANTCIATSTTPLSSNTNSPTSSYTVTDPNVLTLTGCRFMGGVLSLFSSAPAVASSSTNALHNFNHKSSNTPNSNSNNNNNSSAATVTTSDVSSSSNVSQMRQPPQQQYQQKQNTHISKNQQQKQQQQQQPNNRRHQSLTSYMLFNGFHIKARRKERDGDQNSTDTKLYLEESVLERKLPEADLKALVDLPAGLDYNEWLASHTLALFEHVNLVYGTISEFCTTSGCPDMTGPGNRTYLWFDEKGKKTRVAAPQYIDYVMTFTQKTVSDESIFPTKYANEFPSSFESIARKILRLQFHVIAHLYAAHFREIALLGLHTHLNLTFAHLTALHRRFNLIDEKETDVLRDLEVALRLTDDTTGGGNAGSGSSQNDATETNSSSSGGGGGGSGGGSGVDSIKGSLAEDVNSGQHNNLMDCNTTAQPPICTQPEANLKSQQFGGGGGLIGGILGDLSSGEFGDTMHYCTSAVPASSTTNNTSSTHTSTPNTCSTNSTCTTAEQQSTVGAVTANGNNGAGALNFHLNNNNHLAHHPHTHHPHHHHHHHNNVHHHHNHPYAQNTGLIQCNASNAPTATNATTSTTTA